MQNKLSHHNQLFKIKTTELLRDGMPFFIIKWSKFKFQRKIEFVTNNCPVWKHILYCKTCGKMPISLSASETIAVFARGYYLSVEFPFKSVASISAMCFLFSVFWRSVTYFHVWRIFVFEMNKNDTKQLVK